MRRRDAKTLVISLALMLVMCVATTLLSFSLADDTTSGTGGTGDAKGTFSATKTNIDYIIANSKNGGTDEAGRDLTPFYIVEIGSAGSDANSPLKAMVTGDLTSDSDETDISHFVKQVINGWSTQNETMAPNKISYQYISIGSLTSDAAISNAVAAVGKADMVYVSNNPSVKYTSTHDIPEDLKMMLSGVATSNYIPFIIDSPTKTNNGGNGTTADSSFNSLAQNVFAKAGYYRNAFAYDTSSSKSITNYLNRLDADSLWIPIGGDSKSKNWLKDGDGKTTARILTIQSEDSDSDVTSKFKTAAGSTAYAPSELKLPDGTDYNLTGKTAVQLDGTDLKRFGYLSSQTKPDNVVFESIAPTAITTDTDLGVYDIVIVEKGVGASIISADVYNTFSSMVYGMQHIVYDSTMATSQGGENKDTVIRSDAVNYQYVVDKVADANETSRFSNVLVTGMAEMKVYGAATAPSGVKAIADIINNGSYRGSGGGGSSSNLYTVLEIQPCYPIDLHLAEVLQSNGLRSMADVKRQDLPENDRSDLFYYVKTDSVLNGVTSDEISFDGGITSLSDMESTDDGTSGISSRGALRDSDKIYCKDVYAKPAYAKITYVKPVYAKKKRVLTKVMRDVNTGSGWTKVEVYDSQTYWDGSNHRDVVDEEGYIVYKGEYETDADGNPVYETDASGNILLFENKAKKEDIQFGYYNSSNAFVQINDKYDNGYVEYGYETDSSGKPVLYEDKASTAGYVKYGYKTDDSGNVILYENKQNNNEYERYGYIKDESGSIAFSDTQKDGYEAYGKITNAVDYYAWELSKAKVAKLTGLDYNQVNVVHMSSVELSTSRNTLLDNYDAIYIGGNNSAIKEIQYFSNDGRTGGNAALYNMYFHQGGSYDNGHGTGVLTGNDITYNKYVELQSYITAGMPVVFSKALTEAYYGAKAELAGGAYQTLLDPYSNMYRLLDLYMSSTASSTNTNGDLVYTTSKENVLAGFDPADIVKIANDGSYGQTYGGYVTVFGGIEKDVYIRNVEGRNIPTTVKPSTTAVNAEEFSALLKRSKQRPKFSMLQTPALYVEGDASTEITGNTISFKFDVSSKENYTVNVYVDNNTNSRFEPGSPADGGECLLSIGSAQISNNKVSASISDAFDGALYWKFEIVAGSCKGSVTGISKVHVKNKNLVTVLQIAPEVAGTEASDNNNSQLLFCTECQQAKYINMGNRKADGQGKYSDYVRQTAAHFSDANDYSVGGTLPTPSVYDSGYITKLAAGGSRYESKNVESHELGIHEHNFGIVKYDSQYPFNTGNIGSDDWTTNWMYDLLQDYDVNIDIYTTREYEAVIKEATDKVTAANAATVLENYKSLSTIYKNYYLMMKSIIEGKANLSSKTYTYLKNKMTKTNASFVEADVNSFFGETKAAYDLETAKGGLHVSETELLSYLVAQKNLDSYLKALDKVQKGIKGTSKEDVHDEIVYETTYHRYSDFYSLANEYSGLSYSVSYDKSTVASDGTITTSKTSANSDVMAEFSSLFQVWRNAKIWETYFYRMYMKYSIFASMTLDNGSYVPDLTKIYDCIVVGVGERFGDDDIKTTDAIKALKLYVKNDGNTFIFHQTINDGGKTVNLTSNFRTLFGQNYNRAGSTDTDRYHYTPLLKGGNTIATSELHKTYFDTQGLSVNGKDNKLTYVQNGFMHETVNVPILHASDSSSAFASQGKTFTDVATQTNKGVVTLYPFLIGSRLKIAGTHPNSFSTDIENDDLVVYYALDGGSQGTQSAAAAADPKDGIDNYWLYSYGNLTYCGAGHQNVTGLHRDNNDERRLFINVILNSAKKSVFGPTIEVYDPEPSGTDSSGKPIYRNNDITKNSDGIYEMVVGNMTAVPEFTYRVSITDEQDEVLRVKIYYDLSLNSASTKDSGFVTGTDELIWEAEAASDSSILKNLYKQITSALCTETKVVDGKKVVINHLQLDPKYFAPYGQKYTYIVIAVETEKCGWVTQRIMVKIAPKLWDLT